MAQYLSPFFFWEVVAVLLIFAALRIVTRKKREKLRRSRISRNRTTCSIGFLHPHSLSGGGGERVLWCAVLAAQKVFPDSPIVIYSAWTDAGVKVDEAVQKTRSKVREQFGLDLADISFIAVDIKCAHLVDPLQYPRLTLLLQALGTIRLGFHAFWMQPVDVFVDTANLTFSLVLPKAFGAQTVSYVHYPTLSTDMLAVVRTRKAQFNNSAVIANSIGLSYAKLIYYYAFAYLYALVALCCDIPMANSSWTRNHLESLWWKIRPIETVFPPCPTFCSDASSLSERDESLIVSVGQFRPEKNHALQLEMMSKLQSHPTLRPKLLMIGGTRNEADAARAEKLRKEANERGLPVEIAVNVSREALHDALRRASVGVHTMKDEHFGISVVELQAYGLVAVGHRSGGVELDIVDDGVTGLLSGDMAEEYAEKVKYAMQGMGKERREAMREAAVESARRFSEEVFQEKFGDVLARRIVYQ